MLDTHADHSNGRKPTRGATKASYSVGATGWIRKAAWPVVARGGVERWMRWAWLTLFLFWLPSLAASAQTATPSPSPPPAAAQVWRNPPSTNLSIFDPCGGPKELLNKFGPTPCVYISGEAMVSAGYSNISAHGSVSASHGAFAASLPLSGNASVYPDLLLVFGVSPSSQVQISTPSEVSVNTARFGTFSAASDTSLNYKQRVFLAQPPLRSLRSILVTSHRQTGAASAVPVLPIRFSSISRSLSMRIFRSGLGGRLRTRRRRR